MATLRRDMIEDISQAPTDRPIVILYHRLSSEEQASGAGLERQRVGTRAWCRKHDHVARVTLEDIGYSAYTADHVRRGDMGRLLEAIRLGRVAAGSLIVMENLDRLSRQDPFEAMGLLLQILGAGVAVVTTSDGYRYAREGTSSDRMMSVVLSALQFGRGASESETKSTRVGDAWAGKRRAARSDHAPHGKRCPLWIRLVDGKYELIPDRGAELARMFERAGAGWGRRAIVKDLQRRVVPWAEATAKRPHPVWSDSYVQKILTSCEAWGGYRPSQAPKDKPRVFEEIIEGYYPAAVSKEVAAGARAAMILRRGSGGKKGTFPNFLQGLCRCGVCKKAGMSVENKGIRSSGPKLVCRRSPLGACSHDIRYDVFRAEAALIFCIGEHADSLLRANESAGLVVEKELLAARAGLDDVLGRIHRIVLRMQVNDDPALDAALRELRGRARGHAADVARLEERTSTVAMNAGPSSPHAIVDFYERLKAVPADTARDARLEINQRLRTILRAIDFADGGFTVRFRDGAEAWGNIGGSPLPRYNRGRFTAGRRADGSQNRGSDREA